MVAVVFAATAQQLLVPSSFLNNADTVRIADSTTLRSDTRQLTAVEFLANRQDYIVIDVRLSRNYADDHITDAASLPIDSTFWLKDRFVAGLPPESRILLYCQSEHCGWADQTARSGLFRRFRDVSVLVGGLEGLGDTR
jgi:rhodanese-related sulfurtransferase